MGGRIDIAIIIIPWVKVKYYFARFLKYYYQQKDVQRTE